MAYFRLLPNTHRCRLAAAALALWAAMAGCAAYAQVGAPSWWGLTDNNTISLGFLFPQNVWPPQADIQIAPIWYAGATWSRAGTHQPQWAATLSGHTGVMGLTDSLQGNGTLDIVVDNDARTGWVKHVWYQFDVYQVSAETCETHSHGNSGVLFNETGTIVDLEHGWKRVTGSFDILPQPDWEEFTWTFAVQASGKAAIDNVYIGTHCEAVPEPASIVTLVAACAGALLTRKRRLW